VPEYLVVFVHEHIHGQYGRDTHEPVPKATQVMNEHAELGWRVVSVVPGTSPSTESGLFITFERG
jgi:hypothetical protein